MDTHTCHEMLEYFAWVRSPSYTHIFPPRARCGWIYASIFSEVLVAKLRVLSKRVGTLGLERIGKGFGSAVDPWRQHPFDVVSNAHVFGRLE